MTSEKNDDYTSNYIKRAMVFTKAQRKKESKTIL
jgi:hypothetical protein